MLINEKIRLLRQQKGLSQAKMARQLKISITGYGNIERGHTNVSLTKLKQIASILDENIMELAKGYDKNIINTMGNYNTCTQNNQNFYSLFLCPCPCTKNSQLECDLAKLMVINAQQSNEIKLLKQLNELLMEKIDRIETYKNLSTQQITPLPQ
jgi:transcriptional regulator with XRE-family HTH domain